MFTIDYSRKRVAGVLAEIDRLKQSDFPCTHPNDAMDLLDKMFKDAQSVLEKVSPSATADMIHNVCSTYLYQLHVYVPILGFLLRSTNVRNAFEAYSPLLRLAQSIMGTDTKLIVSSEWEFSPFVYQAITYLPGFVLIGLPAPESSNPLLTPLAGHELGHSVWETEGFSAKFKKQLTDGILDELKNKRWKVYSSLYPYKKSDFLDKPLVTQPTWIPAYTWALLQTEEIFCDFFGLRLFAESYLHAFTYMLSPGISGQRSVQYPNITRRVAHLIEAAKILQVEVSVEFESSFLSETEPTDPATSLLVSIADTVSASLVQELITLAKDFADSKQVPKKDTDKVKSISKSFREWVVPARKPASLVDIVNAGWECNMDEHFWENVPQIKGKKEEDFAKNRDRILRDIMLKSMEIAEIYERLEKSL
jgi:hypothetical protein